MNRKALPLTFRHWAGVSPYTSAFALAETYVFGKQFRGLFSCGPLIKMMIELLKEIVVSRQDDSINTLVQHHISRSAENSLWQILILMRGQSLFRSYGRFFAEFLSEGSLVGLGLLDPSTCVGLRYGRQQHKLINFSSQCFTQNYHSEE